MKEENDVDAEHVLERCNSNADWDKFCTVSALKILSEEIIAMKARIDDISTIIDREIFDYNG